MADIYCCLNIYIFKTNSVAWAGFEPPTHHLQRRCRDQLHYTWFVGNLYQIYMVCCDLRIPTKQKVGLEKPPTQHIKPPWDACQGDIEERGCTNFLSKEEACKTVSECGRGYSQITQFSEMKPTMLVFFAF